MRTVGRIVPTGVLGPGLLVIAGFLDGSTQLALWGAALAIDYLGVLVADMQAWRISPDHFAERNGLVLIIALGKSIFAIGVGAGEESLPCATGTRAPSSAAAGARSRWRRPSASRGVVGEPGIPPASEEPHFIQIVPLADDAPSVPELIEMPEKKAEAFFAGPPAELNIVEPGETGTETVEIDIQPGTRYGYVCFEETKDGTPHAFLGMAGEFVGE